MDNKELFSELWNLIQAIQDMLKNGTSTPVEVSTYPLIETVCTQTGETFDQLCEQIKLELAA